MPATPAGRPPARPRPRVLIFGLGGTIAMTAGPATAGPATAGPATAGVVPALSAGQLLAAVAGLADIDVDIDVTDFRAKPGASLTFDDIIGLAAAIQGRLADGGSAAARDGTAAIVTTRGITGGAAGGVAGVVVVQGTDTIEETAYLLDLLLHDQPEPVVVTGAMRNPTLAGADGPANLLAAIQVAASPQTRGLGCLVVANDEIHCAARVRKGHSTGTSTFISPNGGPLGYLVEGVPRVLNQPIGRAGAPTPALAARLGAEHTAEHTAEQAVQETVERVAGTPPASTPGTPQRHRPRVGLYTATLADDPTILAALAAHTDGLVVAGFGVGHVPDTWTAPLGEIAVRIPVVLASRTGAGPVLTRTYGFPGSERDLISRGLIPAGWLHPYKARILLHVLLAAGADRDEIAAVFQTHGSLTQQRTK